ncbi:MAG: DoxX protein [Gemmatimonadota bacterium]
MALHERWFVEPRYPVQWEQALSREFWLSVGIAAGVTALATVVWRVRRGQDIVPGPLELGMERENYQRLMSWLPLVIGLHTAVPLLVAGAERYVLVPNMALSWHFVGGVIALFEIVIALAFVYGALTRPAAVMLALVWLAGVFIFGVLQPLEQAIFLGIAFFLFTTSRGPLALDMALKRLHEPIAGLVPYSVPVLRVLTGIGIIFAALDEKLLNIPMALAFLDSYEFNFFPSIGLPEVSDRTFILMAGTMELTFGLLLISGAFVRLMILILWLPFNLTLPFLGWRELVGHLPIYGVMALLLIWGPGALQPAAEMVRGIEEREDER